MGAKRAPRFKLVWEYKSQTFDHFALLPWNVPNNKYVETVVELAQPHSLFLFDLGYFKLAAFAKIAAAYAYFLSRFNHQTTVREVVGQRTQALDLAQCLRQDCPPLVEKAVILGTRDCVEARLIAVRIPEAIVNERRRQARAVAKKRGYTLSQTHLNALGVEALHY